MHSCFSAAQPSVPGNRYRGSLLQNAALDVQTRWLPIMGESHTHMNTCAVL